MERLPFVTVVMAVRNEGAFIERSLGAVLAQDYPSDRMEVVVADGRSDDRTRDRVRDMSATHPNLKLIDNPQKIVAPGLNLALRESRGELIVRVDGHTVIAADYVRNCVNALNSTDAENVGGRMTPVSNSLFGSAVAAATCSRFGVGGARFHYSQKREFVDTVYLGAWRRDLFDRIGGFDEEMVRNQDDEFNYRLRAHGGKILLDPAIRSEYHNRARPGALWRQYFQYGYWKVRVLQKHPRQMKPRQFVPPVAVITFVLILVLAALIKGAWLAAAAIVAAYLLANILASLRAATRSSMRVLPLLPFTFAVIHFAYGVGFLFGLIRFWNRWSPDENSTSPRFDAQASRILNR